MKKIVIGLLAVAYIVNQGQMYMNNDNDKVIDITVILSGVDVPQNSWNQSFSVVVSTANSIPALKSAMKGTVISNVSRQGITVSTVLGQDIVVY